MIAEAKALTTFFSAYKRQTEDLVGISKKLPLVEEEEEPLLKRGKKAASGPSLKVPIVVRPATRQTMIPTGVMIRERSAPLPEATSAGIPTVNRLAE